MNVKIMVKDLGKNEIYERRFSELVFCLEKCKLHPFFLQVLNDKKCCCKVESNKQVSFCYWMGEIVLE